MSVSRANFLIKIALLKIFELLIARREILVSNVFSTSLYRGTALALL